MYVVRHRPSDRILAITPDLSVAKQIVDQVENTDLKPFQITSDTRIVWQVEKNLSSNKFAAFPIAASSHYQFNEVISFQDVLETLVLAETKEYAIAIADDLFKKYELD